MLPFVDTNTRRWERSLVKVSKLSVGLANTCGLPYDAMVIASCKYVEGYMASSDRHGTNAVHGWGWVKMVWN